MVKKFLTVLLLAAALLPRAQAADDFSRNNPDILKYAFARSYITSLSYMKDIHSRWHRNQPRKMFLGQKQKLILATINDLSLDSSDLLIIKNYLSPYLTSPNKLMRKVADMVVVNISQEIDVNHDEKALWQRWYDLNTAAKPTRRQEAQFVREQYRLEMQRKEADKNIIQASVLMTKVLISAQNKNSKGHLLAVTAKERQSLLDILDSYGSDNLDWGLKSGQSTLEGSIAVIRETLEDPLWTSIDEK